MKRPPALEDSDARDLTTDERLASLARSRINKSQLRVWSDQVQIRCCCGDVTLSGRLPSFYLKQVLQTIVRSLPDVREIANEVHVGAVATNADSTFDSRTSS
jgi:osmotically-inducible protein OsmY